MWLFSSIAIASPWLPQTKAPRFGVSVLHLATQTQFASPETAGRVGPGCPEPTRSGRRIPFDCTTGGRFRNTTVAATLDLAIHEHVAVDAYLPWVLRATFDDDIGATNAFGPGDVRFGVRWGTTFGPWATSFGTRLKLATGPAGLVDRDVPLGDAQTDILPTASLGLSLHPHGWLQTEHSLGLRLRSQRSGIDPGEEWRGSLGGGLQVKNVGVQAHIQGVLAAKDRDAFGLPHPGRRLLQVRGGPFIRHGPWWAEAAITTPLAGWRWPGASTVGLSLAYAKEP